MSGLEEAVLRNIAAVGELSEIVRTSFGPNGQSITIWNRVECGVMLRIKANLDWYRSKQTHHQPSRKAICHFGRSDYHSGD